MRTCFIFLIGFALLTISCSGPKTKPETTVEPTMKWEEQNRLSKAHLRGLHVLSDQVIWASGTEGTVLRSIDSGKNWQNFQVGGAENMDFRDIEAFDESHAVVMSAGNGVHLFYTESGGEKWQEVYADNDSAQFFDGIDFQGKQGFAYGDPIGNKMQCLRSEDGGRSWLKIMTDQAPELQEGEAGFAASGTGIVMQDAHVLIAISGAKQARLLRKGNSNDKWLSNDVPLTSNASSGIFSMAFHERFGIAIGGSYVDSTRTDSNCAVTSDGGQTWTLVSKAPPAGYRSCVAFSSNGAMALATGRTGTDVSKNQGKSWKLVDQSGYFSCGIGTNYAWGVGRYGKIGRMKI